MATIPHGDAALALGKSSVVPGGLAMIPRVDSLPLGVSHDLDNNRYLGPYKHFHDTPFVGTVGFPGFPGFDPVHPELLLDLANNGVNVTSTTVLALDTSSPPAGSRTSRSWSSRPTRAR